MEINRRWYNDTILVSGENNMKKIFRHIRTIIILFLAIVYIVLFFNTPEQPPVSGFEIGEQTRNILKMSIIGIFLLTWFLGMLASIRSFDYAQKTHNEKFKILFHALGIGILVLVVGSAITSFVDQIRNYNPENEEIHRNITIVLNYLYVLIPLISFSHLYCAISHKYLKVKLSHNKNFVVGVAITVAIGSLWTALIFTNPARQGTGLNSPGFYINDTLIIFTIIIPTIFSWFFGVMSTLRMSDIATEIQETLKKRAFSKIIVGVWLLIFDNILLSGLLSVGVDRLMIIGTSGIIVIIYLFVFINLIAYHRLSSGVKEMSHLDISA
jgi:hypothetical protein